MRDRAQGIGPVAAVAGAVGICRVIPALTTLGLLGFLAGLSLSSWVLIGLGAAAAALGGLQLFRRLRRSAADALVAGPNRSTPAGDPVEATDADRSKGTLT